MSVYNIELIENKTNQEVNTPKKATLSEHNKTSKEWAKFFYLTKTRRLN